MCAYAAGSSAGFRYVPEVTYGTTPTTPSMVDLRYTSCSMQLTKDAFQSAELRSDRQIYGFKQGNQRGGGDVAFEFSWKEFDPFLEAACFGKWNSNVLKASWDAESTPAKTNPVSSFSIERSFSDIGQYQVYKGCMVNTFSLSIKPNAMVTGSFNMLAKTVEAMTGTPLDASPTASQAELPFDGFSGTIKEGGTTIGLVTGLDIQLQNGLEALFVLGNRNAAGITAGRSNLTGTLSAFFQDTTMFNKFVNETVSSVEIVLGNGTTKSYTILIPRLVYSGSDTAVSGEGPITLSMPFQSLLDPTEQTNLKITRTAS